MVVADLSDTKSLTASDLASVGYIYNETTDKWNISDAAADFLYTRQLLDFNLPGTLKVMVDHDLWLTAPDKEKYFPVFRLSDYHSFAQKINRHKLYRF